MPFAYHCTVVLKRLTIELLEFFSAAQFLPVVVLLGFPLYSMIVNGQAFLGHTKNVPPLVHAILQHPLWEVLFLSTLLLYVIFRLPGLIHRPSRWWSVRRKTSIVLTLASVVYMALFTFIFLVTHQAVPTIWIVLFGITIGCTLYAFCVRYVVNKVVRSIGRPDFYRPTTAQQTIKT